MMMNNNEHHVVFGTGPVGRAVMRELVAKDKPVRLVNRRGQAEVPAGVEVLVGDATDPVSTRRLCAGATVVYNCTNAPYTAWPQLFPPLQAGILEGAAAAGAKLVAMDNVYLYGPTGGKALTEDLPYAATTRKGRTRATMAQALLEAHHQGKVRVAIGRASDFFGPGVLDSAAGERVFGPALSGKAVQVLGNPDLAHTYTYLPDIGKGLVILGQREEALGRAWHLPSQKTVTTRAFIEMICTETGHRPRVRPIPSLLLQALGWVNPMMRELAEMQYEFQEPFIVDDSDFVQRFGNHATPLEKAVSLTVAWYREREQSKAQASRKGEQP